MFWKDRLRVALRMMGYPEAWTFGPRQAFGFLRYLSRTRPTWRGGVAELNAYSPPVGGEGFRRYLRGLQRISRGEWAPLVAHVSVTDRCGYRCERCSNIARGAADPPLDRLSRLLDDLRIAGTSRVALTGGEPALRDDLAGIVKACGPGLSPLFFTSGQGLDAQRARELHGAGLTAAFVSLDHFAAEEHDRIRGRAGAFVQAVGAIKACLAAGIYTAAQAVVEPPLLQDGVLERYLEFCRRLGVHEVMLLEPVPVGRPGPSGGMGEAARGRLAEVHVRAARDAALPKVSSMSFLEGPDLLGCQAGFSFLYVTAQGDVFPCDFAPLSFGNVYEVGVAGILERLRRLLKRPSQACLALRVRRLYDSSAVRPLSWEETQAVLRDYEPGPPPGLLG